MKEKYKPLLVALVTFTLMLNVLTFLGGKARYEARAGAPVRTAAWSGVAQGCQVEILSPQPGETVGPAGVVEGTASIPEGTHLWVLTRRKGYDLWRKPGGGPARIKGGRWSMRVEYGNERHRGREFHLAAVVAGQRGQSGLSPVGTRFPETVRGCEIQMVGVRRGE